MKTRYRGSITGALLCLTALISCATRVYGQSAPVISPDDAALLKWYGADQASTFNYGGSPSAFAFDGKDLWIALQSANQLIKVRTSDGAILQTISVGSPAALLYDGFRLWVLTSTSSTAVYGFPGLFEIRASDGAILSKQMAGVQAGLAFDGTSIWTFDNENADIRRTAIMFDGTRLWYALPDTTHSGGDTLMAYDVSGNLLLGECRTGYYPVAMAFDGANVWSYNAGDGTLTKCLASTGEALATIQVDSGYRWIGAPAQIAFDGANIWIPNRSTGQVTKVQASTGAILGRFAAGVNAWNVAFDGANIWVANFGDGTVTKM